MATEARAPQWVHQVLHGGYCRPKVDAATTDVARQFFSQTASRYPEGKFLRL